MLEILAMEEDPVDGVGRVLHALEPVARNSDKADDAIDVIPHEAVPARQQRHGLRAEIGEDEPSEFLDWVRGDLHLLFEPASGRLAWLIDTVAGRVIGPAVIGAFDAFIGDEGAVELY